MIERVPATGASRPRALDQAVRRVRRDPTYKPDYRQWPATVPAVAQLLRRGLTLPPGLTVLVGENASGKSTIMELLAEASGLNPQGGSKSAGYRSRSSEPGIGNRLIIERGPLRPHWSYFLRADTMHGFYTYLEEHPGRGSEPRYHELSHGEGFLSLLQTKISDAGFYLLDEPDAPLSFSSSLGLVALLAELVEAGSQIVVATHSPIIAATPNATVLELGGWGFRLTKWQDLELVTSWRRFIDSPDSYFRHLFPDA